MDIYPPQLCLALTFAYFLPGPTRQGGLRIQEIITRKFSGLLQPKQGTALGPLHTAHCKWNILHGTSYMVHLTWYMSHCTLPAACCALHAAHSRLYMVHLTLHTSHFMLHTVHAHARCKLHAAHSTQFLAHSIHCAAHITVRTAGHLCRALAGTFGFVSTEQLTLLGGRVRRPLDEHYGTRVSIMKFKF